MKSYLAYALTLLLILATGGARLSAQQTLASPFKLQFDRHGITSLRYAKDKYDTEYIARYRSLGHLTVHYRMGDNSWQEFSTTDPKHRWRELSKPWFDPAVQHRIVYNQSSRQDFYADLEVTEGFRAEEDGALYWTIHLRNATHKPLELGDLVLPLPFNTEKRWDKTISYTQRLVQHHYVSGHGSFVYWMRPNSEGPYLVMTPVFVCPLFESSNNERNFKPAKLEYVDQQGVYILSGRAGALARERGGNWRQPQTSVVLSPRYSPDDEVTYVFKFRWADEYEGVRNVLYEEGLVDVNIVPGMTVPEDLDVMLSLRTRSAIKSLLPEFTSQTQIEDLGEKAKDTHVYKVKFARLGENKLTLNFGNGQYTVLEFFVTEPLATLIKKRAAFLVNRQLHRDPAKWYNGLFSEWDMRAKVLRSPDDTGGLADYVLAGNDPGLGKAAFVAGKNVDYPDPREIEALEYHLENYVWGKHQQTDKEKYPYAIYGTENWKMNRDSKPNERAGWSEHLWRVFDYPHFVHLYWNMYRIAKFYPELTRYQDKEGYLQRAFGTAQAFYTVPLKTAGWSANDVGNYNELVIADLIQELYAVGWKDKADWLRAKWEEKVEHFVNDRPNLFHSEYAFDPTGFESHHAFAKYAVEESRQPSFTLRVKPAGAADFMTEEIAGNIATRGWLEPAYHQLGVEGNMRYMSQMGGWSILDYALYYATDPAKYLRLGYASYLSSWALMNTGTPESNYGYWYPGKENDGGAGSAFLSQAYGRSWLGVQQPRGPWPYSAEIDLGFGGALRCAATIVIQDPLFGLIAYGGQVKSSGKLVEVLSMDGLSRRFHVILGQNKLHLLLDRDGIATGQPVRFDDTLTEISFALESRARNPSGEHQTEMSVAGLPPGSYDVSLDGRVIQRMSGGSAWQRVPLRVMPKKQVAVVIRKAG